METIFERVGALDVHKAQVTACVRVPDEAGRREPHVAEFATTVAGLLALSDWLKAFAVTHVAMEATGVYWQPVWHILEDDFELMLVNARHVKNVPGRKTDVSDAQWLCQLMEAGLLRSSFVPPKPQLGAVKHSILIAYWHMFTNGETYRDLGGDYFARRDPERATKRLVAKLEALGHTITIQPAAA